MKNIFIALSIFFGFSQAICQSKDNKPTTEKKNVISINELLQGKWQSMDDKTNFLMFDENERKATANKIKSASINTILIQPWYKYKFITIFSEQIINV